VTRATTGAAIHGNEERASGPQNDPTRGCEVTLFRPLAASAKDAARSVQRDHDGPSRTGAVASSKYENQELRGVFNVKAKTSRFGQFA
jgi:hypothetical protein